MKLLTIIIQYTLYKPMPDGGFIKVQPKLFCYSLLSKFTSQHSHVNLTRFNNSIVLLVCILIQLVLICVHSCLMADFHLFVQIFAFFFFFWYNAPLIVCIDVILPSFACPPMPYGGYNFNCKPRPRYCIVCFLLFAKSENSPKPQWRAYLFWWPNLSLYFAPLYCFLVSLYL